MNACHVCCLAGVPFIHQISCSLVWNRSQVMVEDTFMTLLHSPYQLCAMELMPLSHWRIPVNCCHPAGAKKGSAFRWTMCFMTTLIIFIGLCYNADIQIIHICKSSIHYKAVIYKMIRKYVQLMYD